MGDERRKPRALASDGTVHVERRGVKRHLVRDIYHVFRTVTWPQLLGGIALVWLLVNLVFAELYLRQPGSIHGAEVHAFSDAFFFSVQTLSTIGYGAMSPATTYAHVLVTVQALFGLVLTAMTTGVVFAKFATPTARILFARHALITDFDGERVFMFRIANERTSQVVEAAVRVALLRDATTSDGRFMRRFVDLPLKRESSPIFQLGWTVFHVIDEDSPLYGLDAADLEAVDASFVVVFMGTDDVLAATVHARHAYDWEDVRFDRHYANIVQPPAAPGGQRVVDYRRFHDLEPAEKSRSG